MVAGTLASGAPLPRSIRRTLSAARLDCGEIEGSPGDLGTFLPLRVGMDAPGIERRDADRSP
jgi:hypothetical protein